MSNIYGAYLDDYNCIKLIAPLEAKLDNIYLKGINNSQKLVVQSVETYGPELHVFLKYNDDISLHRDYYVQLDNLNYHLKVGKITRSKRFDDDYFYDGDLGFCYHHDYTEFKVWSPVCKEVILYLNDEKYPLSYLDKGVWYAKIKGDFDRAKYYYEIRVDDEYIKVLDPYAISSMVNNEFNYVVNLENTYQMLSSYYQVETNNIVIYEINIRDLVSNINNHDSLYLKNIDNLRYIKNLGVTHLQMMPTFAFGGVDESIKSGSDSNFKYNWGYNPVQYMVPSGWYASDPCDPYARINELKMLIDKAHELQLGVNLDVVFNHVYKYESFSWGLLVPGYVYRTDERGFLMNSSYCGNDLRTEAKMIRKYITDVVLFYQKFYMIDGFRFDLMGLIDIVTIFNLTQVLPKTMMYGEGWYMNTTLPMNENANIGSASKLPTVSFFNDYFRNIIGGSFGHNNGFILGDDLEVDKLRDVLFYGSKLAMSFISYNQSINYLECHDNFTLYDKIMHRINDFDKAKNACMLGLGLVVIASGIAFIHSGEELMRSKRGIDNSYNLPDDINHFPWENLNTKFDIKDYLKNLLMVKNMGVFTKLEESNKKDNYYEFRFNNGTYQLLIKNNYELTKVYFCPGTTLLFNNGLLSNDKVESLNLDCPGIWVLKKRI